jgi:hypothetical protein
MPLNNYSVCLIRTEDSPPLHYCAINHESNKVFSSRDLVPLKSQVIDNFFGEILSKYGKNPNLEAIERIASYGIKWEFSNETGILTDNFGKMFERIPLSTQQIEIFNSIYEKNMIKMAVRGLEEKIIQSLKDKWLLKYSNPSIMSLEV